jgi:L-lactate dehydrogenase (cytochrome)
MSDELITGMRLLGANRVSDLKPELLEIMPGLLGQQPKGFAYKQDNQ